MVAAGQVETQTYAVRMRWRNSWLESRRAKTRCASPEADWARAAAQSSGTAAASGMRAASLNRQNPDQQIQLGDYVLNVGLPRNRRTPAVVPDVTGYGIFMATGPDEYLLAGNNLQITFTPHTPGPPIAGIARQENGHFENGKWVVTRFLAGDDSVLRYD